jgi:biotin carboxyl carrier protein
MKLKAELSGHEFELILDLGGKSVIAEIEGRKYQLDVHQSADDNYLIFDGGHVFDCRVNQHHGSRESFDVAVRGNNYSVAIIDPRKIRTNQDYDRHHHGTAEIIALMPGKVVRVLVETGQEIEAGTGIVVVEAMKMQNEMKSPRAGVVRSMNVEAGATVEAGAVLAVIA